MWFINFGSDIHVSICMSFVLVKLFDALVYSFCNGGYLSGEYLGFYWLFGASGGFIFGVCNGGYCYICCFMGLLKIVCIYCGRNS